MPSIAPIDACERCRSPAIRSSVHPGLPPRNPGQRYPTDPRTVEETIAACMPPAPTTTESACTPGSS